MGDRAYCPETREFLTPDPLPPVPGVRCAASPYAFAAADPVNLLDPTGRQPVSDAGLQHMRNRALLSWDFAPGQAGDLRSGLLLSMAPTYDQPPPFGDLLAGSPPPTEVVLEWDLSDARTASAVADLIAAIAASPAGLLATSAIRTGTSEVADLVTDFRGGTLVYNSRMAGALPGVVSPGTLVNISRSAGIAGFVIGGIDAVNHGLEAYEQTGSTATGVGAPVAPVCAALGAAGAAFIAGPAYDGVSAAAAGLASSSPRHSTNARPLRPPWSARHHRHRRRLPRQHPDHPAPRG
ncbi:hypothetical protein BH23ACT9_BH23ACT9_25470 [soil metagenome]